MARSINPAPQYDNDGNPVIGGKMYWFETGTSTPKTTYADSLLTTPNPHPVILDSQGILPPTFFDGSAKQVLTDADDVQLWERDPVGSEDATGGQFEEYNALVIYEINDLVIGSDGKYYRSISNANQGNDPVTPSPSDWTEIRFLEVYNSSNTYNIGDVVMETTGLLWRSNSAGNQGNTPNTDNGTNWLPAVDTENVLSDTNTVIVKAGGGALLALRVNELTDSSAYTLPLANSVSQNQIITIDLPSIYSDQTPTVSTIGGDTITDINGADTEILFDGQVRIILTSDGVSDWRL
jgi:hypothetical protein